MQFVAMAISQKREAERILKEEKDRLTPEQVKYLEETIRQGENAERIMAKYIEARDKALKEEKQDERQERG